MNVPFGHSKLVITGTLSQTTVPSCEISLTYSPTGQVSVGRDLHIWFPSESKPSKYLLGGQLMLAQSRVPSPLIVFKNIPGGQLCLEKSLQLLPMQTLELDSSLFPEMVFVEVIVS